MPFPDDVKVYQAMYTQADVISAAIDSLDVQVSWAGARLDGVPGEESKFEPLISALAEYGGLDGALQSFTKEIFVNGNVAVFVGQEGCRMWRPDWQLDAALSAHAGQGNILQAKRLPLSPTGYGTPVVEPGVRPFVAYWKQQDAHVRELEEFSRNPSGRLPPSRRADDLKAMNAVLNAIGFNSWTGDDTPSLQDPARLRAEVKDLFVAGILQPYGRVVGVNGTPTIILR